MHFECLKRLREDVEVAWDVLTMRSAAREVHLECRYLLKNGCPWDRWAYRAVASGGNTVCQEYLRKHGCPMGDDENDNAVQAARFDDNGEERRLFVSAQTVI